MFNKRTNNNYRTHQTYLERVNNYINHMYNKNEENLLAEEEPQQYEEPQPPQPPANTFIKGQMMNNSNQNSSRRFQPSFKPSSSLQQQQQGGQGFNKFSGQSSNKLNAPDMQEEPVQEVVQPEKPRRVTANDLRNKRNNIVNHTYSSYNAGGKKNPSYSVKFAISSGGYQTDSL
jgi:hypothetical protein